MLQEMSMVIVPTLGLHLITDSLIGEQPEKCRLLVRWNANNDTYNVLGEKEKSYVTRKNIK